MAGIKKKQIFDYKNVLSSSTKYKEESFYYCGDAFSGACGFPGPVMGGINMFLGHSNSGKTNALILTAVDAQKKGHLPVFIITEKKWDWNHAVEMGLQAEKDNNGEWKGDFIFKDDFKTIEEATDFVNLVLNHQEKDEIDRDIVFLWDSVGSLPCQMTYEGKGGKMHNASVLADRVGMGISARISDSKKIDYPYINTMCVVNQPWVELPDNPFGQPEIKPKGGNAFFLAASLVFLFGNQKKAGVNFIEATKNNRKVVFATRTRISIIKNHVNAISYKDGKIIATAQGFISDSKPAVDKYKEQYSSYWKGIFESMGEYGDDDFELTGLDKKMDKYDGDEGMDV